MDYSVGGASSSCSPCGGGSAGVGSLPSVSVTRMLRPRYAEGTPGELHPSFGVGSYWKEYDKAIRFRETADGSLTLHDPSSVSRTVTAVYNPLKQGWSDARDGRFELIRGFDAAGNQVTSLAQRDTIRVLIKTLWTGESEVYEVFRLPDSHQQGIGRTYFAEVSPVLLDCWTATVIPR